MANNDTSNKQLQFYTPRLSVKLAFGTAVPQANITIRLLPCQFQRAATHHTCLSSLAFTYVSLFVTSRGQLLTTPWHTCLSAHHA